MRTYKILQTIEREKNPPPLPRRLPSEVVEFLMLTAVRMGQIVGNRYNHVDPLRWRDIDFESRLWICRYHKARKKRRAADGKPLGELDTQTRNIQFDENDHVVPLSRQAMAVLERMKERQTAAGLKSEFVFVQDGLRGLKGHPINNATVAIFLRKSLGRADLTLHGFRTTFRTWAGENGYPETDSEMALAHVCLNKGTRMYARFVQRIEPRRLMMQAWADFCDRTEPLTTAVIPFRKTGEDQDEREH